MASSTISSCAIEKIRKECYYEWMSLQPNKHIVDLIEVIMFQRSNADDHHTRKLVENLQQDVADMPMVIKVFSEDLVEIGEAVEEALDKHEEGMTVLMAEADKLRLDTIRTIVEPLEVEQGSQRDQPLVDVGVWVL
ncbi:unnamed protein product [Brassica rapa]|uniref:Uncharacterized protein n=2 Tax=Brassica TaxID=3705 RepID=A0A8D9GTX6_BRACM|nr:unnamed protein product [Brassica napus]CAG7886994.1 unnamed protein product [Brassica rapa]